VSGLGFGSRKSTRKTSSTPAAPKAGSAAGREGSAEELNSCRGRLSGLRSAYQFRPRSELRTFRSILILFWLPPLMAAAEPVPAGPGG
jgi:hypothetical protein